MKSKSSILCADLRHLWVSIAFLPTLAVAQPPADSTAPAAKLLEDVRDNVFSFDEPAFYWFCRYVHEGKADAVLDDVWTGEALPWKMLMERPSDYRGKPVVIEGFLQTCHAFDVSNRQGLGRLYQCELADVNTRALCAVVCTLDPTNMPLRSRVRAKGFFIKVRAYQTTSGETGAGPLIVAKKLQLITPPASGIPGGGPRGILDRWMIPAVVVLVLVWIGLRRRAGRARAMPSASRSKTEGSNDSDDDFDWLSQDRPHNPDSGTNH